MRLIAILIFMSLASACCAQASFCQLSGAVLEEKEPARAQFKVYREDSESFADLVVFRAENMLFADKPGKWFFTEVRSQARFSVFWVTERSHADFSIFITETESFAGCQNSR